MLQKKFKNSEVVTSGFDKVCMYEEIIPIFNFLFLSQMMTNDDNLESNLTSSFLKIRRLYKFCRAQVVLQVVHVEPDVYVEVKGDWRVTAIYTTSVNCSITVYTKV